MSFISLFRAGDALGLTLWLNLSGFGQTVNQIVIGKFARFLIAWTQQGKFAWDRALKNHTLLPEATQREMLTGQALSDTVNKT